MLQERMEAQFEFSEQEGGVELVRFRDGGDFPYRIRPVEGGFKLDQGFSPRAYMPVKFRAVGSFKTREECLARIVKRYNQSCAYMATRTLI